MLPIISNILMFGTNVLEQMGFATESLWKDEWNVFGRLIYKHYGQYSHLWTLIALKLHEIFMIIHVYFQSRFF
jgi:hypothetical protein